MRQLDRCGLLQQGVEPEESLAVMLVRVGALCPATGDIVVQIGNPRSDLDSPGGALDRRKAEEGQKVVYRVAAHLVVIEQIKFR